MVQLIKKLANGQKEPVKVADEFAENLVRLYPQLYSFPKEGELESLENNATEGNPPAEPETEAVNNEAVVIDPEKYPGLTYESAQSLSDEDLRQAVEDVTGKKPHWKASRETLLSTLFPNQGK